MRKLLVANRGEIALRIMRSAREMGIATVAVYSEADRNAPFVRYADEAVAIGPPPAAQSYLVVEKIIGAAKATGADAIHPGYGFLSENPVFAAAVEDAGLTFVGPSPRSMEMMGNKLAAKQAAREYDVPLVPGTAEPISEITSALEIAGQIGYPILIKAAAGGGGKGMRIVNQPADFAQSVERAMSEAQAAFGDGSVFLEKYVGSPKHIEIQVLADKHGNVVYLFERDCSIQRRHQKVVEEAPSAVLTPQLRQSMGESAVRIARACHYIGAGTVEFLLDKGGSYYFLEMNTRLQVEHPVTEMITGLDLVKEQIKVARGEKLTFAQDDLSINGHSIELRLYAEDPSNNFLPDIGTLEVYRPCTGPGVRVDSGFEEGMEIPVFYDPMIAKLVVHAEDRPSAIGRMLRAIDEFKLTGVANTLAFGRFVMQHPEFISGQMDTHFVENHFSPEKLESEWTDDETAAAAISALAFYVAAEQQAVPAEAAAQPQSQPSRWLSRAKK